MIAECVVEAPSASSDAGGKVNCLVMKALVDGYPHVACVIRDNVVDCGSTNSAKDFRGIVASGGRGTIVEQNRVWNCMRGFFMPKGTGADHSTLDLIIRDNYFCNTLEGINLEMDAGQSFTVSRVAILENQIELPTSGSTIGIRLNGESSATKKFKQAIIRQNQIRHVDGANGPNGAIGIDLDSVENAIEDENLVNVGETPTTGPGPTSNTRPLKRDATASVKTFNNQTTAGVFLPSTYGSPQRQDPDLVTDAQDWMLGI